MDVPLVYQQLYGPSALPFKLPPTHYQLVIGSISIALDLKVQLKASNELLEPSLADNLNDFIANFNAQSEKKERKNGLIHNWQTTIHGNAITVELDLGSAGSAFLKQLLKWFNKFETIDKVFIGYSSEFANSG